MSVFRYHGCQTENNHVKNGKDFGSQKVDIQRWDFSTGGPKFLFWDHFLCWMAWTALTWLGVAQFSQGGATGHTKFQVFAYFLPFRGPQGPKIGENVH